MTTLAIIVTYADRYHLLSKVIKSCFVNGVNEVLVVDNGSVKSSKVKLKELSQKNDQLNVIWNAKNLGSAKAYKQALAQSQTLNVEQILLLDDDNKLADNSLSILKDFWETKKSKKTKVLLAFRPDRQLYKIAIQLNDPEYVLSPKNSFYGFHIWYKLKKLFTKTSPVEINIKSGKIAYAPFGGMYFNKSLIDEIGLPREDFFLYSDDHEWSYRAYKKGFNIELVLQSEIEDIDTSWAINKKNIFKTIKSAEPKRVYYTIRNRIVFERNERVNHKFIYLMNLRLFKFILFIYCKNNTQYDIFKKAIIDAFEQKLGQKSDDYFNC